MDPFQNPLLPSPVLPAQRDYIHMLVLLRQGFRIVADPVIDFITAVNDHAYVHNWSFRILAFI
jgi:hypothetical protein